MKLLPVRLVLSNCRVLMTWQDVLHQPWYRPSPMKLCQQNKMCSAKNFRGSPRWEESRQFGPRGNGWRHLQSNSWHCVWVIHLGAMSMILPLKDLNFWQTLNKILLTRERKRCFKLRQAYGALSPSLCASSWRGSWAYSLDAKRTTCGVPHCWHTWANVMGWSLKFTEQCMVPGTSVCSCSLVPWEMHSFDVYHSSFRQLENLQIE